MHQIRKCRRDKYKNKKLLAFEELKKEEQAPEFLCDRDDDIGLLVTNLWEFKGGKGSHQLWSLGNLHERGYKLHEIDSYKDI